MGNFCNKLYYSIPHRQKCPYCPKSPFISETETAFKISTQGCRVCRIKMKYYFKKGINLLNKISANNKNLNILSNYFEMMIDRKI